MGCKVSTNTPTCLCDAAVPQATCHQPSSRDLISGCKETQSAWLNTLVLESNSVTTMARSECAWFSQCVISPPLDDLPFSSSSLPFSALLKLPGEEQTQALLSRTHIWTLQNTQGLHRHANSHSLDLQMDFYLFTLSRFFLPNFMNNPALIRGELEHGGDGNSSTVPPLFLLLIGRQQSVFWHSSRGSVLSLHASSWYGHI